MLKKLVQENYNINVETFKLLVDHLETKIFLVESDNVKYVLKEVKSDFLSHPENEGMLMEYLCSKGISVPKIIKTNNGEYLFSYGEKKFNLQKYIDGEAIGLNDAPEWYLHKSSQTLGKIQNILREYKKLPTLFDKEFLSKSNVLNMKDSILSNIQVAREENNNFAIEALNVRLKHIERISCFEFDTDEMTYTNSHGDYYVSQIITQNQEFTVIDWTGACFLPACFEVIMSYTYADPFCKNGSIDSERFKTYLNEYLKYFSLNKYDLKIMPYFYYYQLCLCNFVPPYDELPNDYLEIAKLCDNFMNWLYLNVDDLSNQLCAL